uniref:Glycosyltransferase 2-like domain-containing protein n=1 Tax=viral metagenome TaxID=1070528 RepID=A0A6C0DPD8_9ZZZZ
MPRFTFLYNRSNPFGISEDVKLLSTFFKQSAITTKHSMEGPTHADPLEPPVASDILFHFEIPVYSWMSWARVNVLIVNPEWFEEGWKSYMDRFDLFVFKCSADAKRFQAMYPDVQDERVFVVPWTTHRTPTEYEKYPRSPTAGCLWLLGGSHSKREAAKKLLPLWDITFPPLTVYTTTSLELENLPINVTLRVESLGEETRKSLQAKHSCHLIFSQAEACSLVAAEGQSAGAYLIGNALPTYVEQYGDCPDSVTLLPATLIPWKAAMRDTFETENLKSLLEQSLATAFSSNTFQTIQKKKSEERRALFSQHVTDLFCRVQQLWKTSESLGPLPPILSDEECPPISVITLTYNRRKFLELCFHNLMITDYPKDKIEWIVVEDSDIQEEQASDLLMKFGRSCSPLSFTYHPLQKKHTIGEKRNLAVKRAEHSIVLMMDDDDHYPVTSFRRRVAWLLKHPWKPKATVCSMIACYDLVKGMSAVNTPPWTLPLRQRISEATLTFYKDWWMQQEFPSTSLAEGEAFLEGREGDVLELPPQQIIVAMSHGASASDRRLPSDVGQKPSCFWGFPKEFLIFLHRLAGVEIEEIEH